MLEKEEVTKIIIEINKSKHLWKNEWAKKEVVENFQKLICQDGDENYFINYLGFQQEFDCAGYSFKPSNYFELISNNKNFISNLDMVHSEKQRRVWDLENHEKRLKSKIKAYGSFSDLIKNGKYKANEVELRRKVQMKYMWSVDYYNKSCELAGMPEYKINCKISMDNTVHLPKVEVVELNGNYER